MNSKRWKEKLCSDARRPGLLGILYHYHHNIIIIKKVLSFSSRDYDHCHHSHFHFAVFLKTLHLTSWIINVGFQCFGNILNDDIGNHFERWYLIFENILNVYICLRSPSQPSLSPPSLLCRGANQIIKLTFHCNTSFLLFVGYLSLLLLVPCTYYYFFWCQYINIYLCRYYLPFNLTLKKEISQTPRCFTFSPSGLVSAPWFSTWPTSSRFST